VGSTAENLDFTIVGDARRKAEVYNLDVTLIVQQQILQLDVSMGDAPAVTVQNTFYYLPKHAFCLSFY